MLSVKSHERFRQKLTIQGKVDTTQRNTAATIIVDAHREVVALHERNWKKQMSKKQSELEGI